MNSSTKKSHLSPMLNCDLGETDAITAKSIEHLVMPHIHQANIACGAHAGNRETMQATIAIAKSHHVAIGAHPSYPDREGFGRRSIDITIDALKKSLQSQLFTFIDIAIEQKALPSYVKAHGALYNDLAKSKSISAALFESVLLASEHLQQINPSALPLKVMVSSHVPSWLITMAQELNIELIYEAFADRRYCADGQLMPRNTASGKSNPQAVLSFLQAMQQVHYLHRHSVVFDESGLPIDTTCDSICVHGDNKEAAELIALFKLMLDAPFELELLNSQSFLLRTDQQGEMLLEIKKHLDNQFSDFILNSIYSSKSLLIETKNDEKRFIWLLKSTLCLTKNLLTEHQNQKSTSVKLPVYYGDDVALDLAKCAEKLGITSHQLIEQHLSSKLKVEAIGFAPGFAYLSGLPSTLNLPRLATPRTKVPQGSVAIANGQTAIYPNSSPGGWSIIGNCPIPLFNLNNDQQPMPFELGDEVEFYQIDKTEFDALQAQNKLSTPKVCGASMEVEGQSKTTISALKVVKPGVLATLQDSGRFHVSHLGLTNGGAADMHAYELANRLLANPLNSTAIEITLGNARFECLKECSIAIAGGVAPLNINHRPVPQWQSLQLKTGDILDIGYVQKGLRVYLAIQGGFVAPQYWHSTSVVVREGIGSQIKEHQVLSYDSEVKKLAKSFCDSEKRSVSPTLIPDYPEHITVRLQLSSQSLYFKEQSLSGFEFLQTTEFVITPQSDRMGIRLKPTTDNTNNPFEHDVSISSEGMPYGAVQIPPDGNPIIMLNDRQTIGGYPKIGQVLQQDAARLSQARPGTKVHFKVVPFNLAT